MKKTKKENKNPVEKYSKRAWDYFWITTILTFFCSAFVVVKFANQNINIMELNVIKYFVIFLIWNSCILLHIPQFITIS
jgi:hypothetical protein